MWVFCLPSTRRPALPGTRGAGTKVLTLALMLLCLGMVHCVVAGHRYPVFVIFCFSCYAKSLGGGYLFAICKKGNITQARLPMWLLVWPWQQTFVPALLFLVRSFIEGTLEGTWIPWMALHARPLDLPPAWTRQLFVSWAEMLQKQDL